MKVLSKFIILSIIFYSFILIAKPKRPKIIDGKNTSAAFVNSVKLKSFFANLKKDSNEKSIANAKKIFLPNHLIKKEDRDLFDNVEKQGSLEVGQSVEYIFFNNPRKYLSVTIKHPFLVHEMRVSHKSGGIGVIYNYLKKIPSELAIKLFHNYNLERSREVKAYTFAVSEYKKHRIFNVNRKGFSPAIDSYYIMNFRGDISPLDLEHLTWFFEEKEKKLLKKDKKEFAKKFILEYSYYLGGGLSMAKMIEDISDIPEYSKNKLDADLEKTIRPFWSYTKDQYKIFIVYSYNKLGGAVNRYKFIFNTKNKSLSSIKVLNLGKNIGAPSLRI